MAQESARIGRGALARIFIIAVLGCLGAAVLGISASYPVAAAGDGKSAGEKKSDAAKKSSNKSAGKDATGSGSKSKVGQLGKVVELAPFIVPMIQGREIIAQYSVTVVIELNDENSYDAVGTQMAKIRNSIYKFLYLAVSQRTKESNIPRPELIQERTCGLVLEILGKGLLYGVTVKNAKTIAYGAKD